MPESKARHGATAAVTAPVPADDVDAAGPSSGDYATEDLIVRTVGSGVTIARVRYPTLNGMIEIVRMTEELTKLIDGGHCKIVFDCKYVRHAGSAALGMLISIQKKLQKAGGKLVISHSENLGPLLKVSRTESLFTLTPDPRTAVKLF